MLFAGGPRAANIRPTGQEKKFYPSLIAGCVNAAKPAVALQQRQLVIPGVASSQFVLCSYLKSRTRYVTWSSHGGDHHPAAWCSLPLSLRWAEERGDNLRSWVVAQCTPRAASLPLCSPCPRKGFAHPWGKAVSGRGVVTASPLCWSR